MVAVSLVVLLLLCAAAGTGCLGVKTPPVSREPAPAVFVDYHRTGGVAGSEDRLVIFDNGAAIVSTKTVSREFVVNQTEITGITDLFARVQFSQLQENYPSRRGNDDLTRYSISYKSKTVTLEESAYPPSVQPLLDELNRIIRKAAA